jgi:hypothetical protein
MKLSTRLAALKKKGEKKALSAQRKKFKKMLEKLYEKDGSRKK